MTSTSRLHRVFINKCPRCHQGDFFVTPTAFNRHFDHMHEHCLACGENFMPEPGFYWASMFVSYALTTIWTLATFLVAVVWQDMDLTYYLIGLTGSLLGLTPFFFRLARRTWLTLFVKPDLTRGLVR